VEAAARALPDDTPIKEPFVRSLQAADATIVHEHIMNRLPALLDPNATPAVKQRITQLGLDTASGTERFVEQLKTMSKPDRDSLLQLAEQAANPQAAPAAKAGNPIVEANQTRVTKELGDPVKAEQWLSKLGPGEQLLLYGGLSTAAVGLLGHLFTEEGGVWPWLLTILGLGAAVGGAAAGGAFGKLPQQGIRNLMATIRGKTAPAAAP